MRIKNITNEVFINAVPAVIGNMIKPYDMVDTRSGTLELETGEIYSNICARALDLPVIAVDVAKEVEVPAEVIPSKVEPTTTAKNTQK